MAVAVVALSSVAGCSEGEDPDSGSGGSGGSGACKLALPASYDASAFESNAATERDVIVRFDAFLQPMKDAELSPAVKPTSSELAALFDAGSPSLRSLTTSYYQSRVDGWLTSFEAAAGNGWQPAEPPAANGGIYEKWIFDERGTDLRQAIEKGMFAATHYARARAIADSEPGPAAIDRVLVLFGAHPSFPQDDKHPDHPDRFSAQYAKRRDDKTDPEPGLYRRLKASFIEARTAAAAGEACKAERDAAVSAIFDGWERVLAATVIYYVNDATKKLTVDPPTDADTAAGLHSLGEATGFVHGFRQLEASHKQITDAEIDELLALLNAPASGPVDTYEFATDTASHISKLAGVSAKLKDIYAFTDAEMVKFELAH